MTTMSRPFFHKLVLSSTLNGRKLRIPDSFVKKFRGELSTVARLIVPDGRVWHIGLGRAENKFWFQDGWQGFVEYYTIRVGFFLVFKYEGSSTFSVFIYNLTSSEINYQSNALRSTGEPNRGKNTHVFEEMEDDDSAGNLGFSPPCRAPNSMNNKVFDKRVDGQVTLNKSFNPPLKNLLNGSNYQNCIIRPTEGEMKLHSSSDDIQRIKKTIRKKRKIDPDKQESSADPEDEVDTRFRFYESASARKRTVTSEERERALNAAKMFEPSNPFCRVVLRPSYLYRGCIMYLPSCFAEKNLNGVSGFIKLQLSDGKQWPVRCLYKGGRAKLSQGWYEFTLENNLGEGDVCVFELLRMKEVVLKVTAFRIIQDARFANHPVQQNVSFIMDNKYAQVNSNLNSIYVQKFN